MINIYQDQLAHAGNLQNPSEKLTFLTSILRSLLQLCGTTSLEVVKELTPTDDPALDELIERFRTPSDGLPIQILDKTVSIIRSYVDTRFLSGWFEPTAKCTICISRQLQDWVEFRNTFSAHGVLDQTKTREWSEKTHSLIVSCIDVFKQAIPECEPDEKLKVSFCKKDLYIQTPLLINSHAIVISKVVQKPSGWKMKVQLLSNTKSEMKTVDLCDSNVFANLENVTEIYKIVEVYNNETEQILEHNIPKRQTDNFEGRENEITLLKDWLEDEDSRRCLIYGDGGYGKTTLVLEALNLLLEGALDIKRELPNVICYYTAKKTRWTSEGITYFTSVEPVIEESIRELLKCLFTVLPPEWYKISGRALVDKAANELRNNKFSRDDVLIILDNTETLATTSQQTKELARLIELIGKTLGRVIITSRRQEGIEAKQILIEGLSDSECVNLLKSLAKEHDAESISMAGEANLRKVSNKLMKKPILLEALAVYIGRAKVGIDQALENLYRKSNDELLEFLYEDAWERISHLQKEAFYVMVSLTCPLDKYSVSRACQLVEIQHSEFQASLSETHFSTITDYGSHYELELADLAHRFFKKKLSEQPENIQDRIQSLATEVDQYSSKRHDIEQAYRKDRVAEAFRNEYAKAAKVESDKGNTSLAIEMYELAIEEDPLNSALHDRFAWLLLNKAKLFDKAKDMAEKAIKLNPQNCDAVVTLALTYYRLDEMEVADSYIDDSVKLGRPLSFALLRKAIARFHKVRSLTDTDIKQAVQLNQEARNMLTKAEKQNSIKDGYDAKNLVSIQRHQQFLLKQASKLERMIKKQLIDS